jgi:hypothetical protein
MKKQIKRQGSQNIISFTSKELEIYGWNVGDVLDLIDAYKVGPSNYPSYSEFKDSNSTKSKEVQK